jgi:hypothetical protein
LLAASLIAIFVTQRLRAEGTVISEVQTSRSAFRECPVGERGPGIPISFQLEHDDIVSAEIVSFDRPETVRRLFSDRPLSGPARHCAPWDGLDDSGKPAKPGSYRLKIGLADLQKEATAGEPIRLGPGTAP